eukprot:Gb_36219 [translate_table: standard]
MLLHVWSYVIQLGIRLLEEHLCCAQFGDMSMGADIDIRVVCDGHGPKHNVWINFNQHNLPIPISLIRADNNLPPWCPDLEEAFDAIICDPPYGVCVGGQKSSGRKLSKGVVGPYIIPVDRRRDHIPLTTPYNLVECASGFLSNDPHYASEACVGSYWRAESSALKSRQKSLLVSEEKICLSEKGQGSFVGRDNGSNFDGIWAHVGGMPNLLTSEECRRWGNNSSNSFFSPMPLGSLHHRHLLKLSISCRRALLWRRGTLDDIDDEGRLTTQVSRGLAIVTIDKLDTPIDAINTIGMLLTSMKADTKLGGWVVERPFPPIHVMYVANLIEKRRESKGHHRDCNAQGNPKPPS